MAITNATAVPAPLSLLRAKLTTLFGLPPGSKSSPGSNIRHIPVKALSNAFIDTV